MRPSEFFSYKQAPTFIVSATECGPNCSHDFKSKECAFRVEWKINAHMKEGAVDSVRARSEHDFFKETLLNAGAYLIEVPFLHGSYDSVFTKDNGIVGTYRGRRTALLGKPATFQRRLEQSKRRQNYEEFGFEVELETEFNLEGGDAVISPRADLAFLGYGFRSSRQAARQLKDFLGCRVIDLELRDPYFYHLDTAFALTMEHDRLIAFAVRDAFTEESWMKLQREERIETLVEVPRDEALRFGLNWVEVADTIILGSHVPYLAAKLERFGKEVEIAPLSQFQLAGGSAACLTSRVHDLSERPSQRAFADSMSVLRTEETLRPALDLRADA